MENESKRKWLSILFFSLSGAIFGTALYLITIGSTPSPGKTTVTVASAANALPYPDEPRVVVTLKRDTRQRLGKLDIIYRGVKNRAWMCLFLTLTPSTPTGTPLRLNKPVTGFVSGVSIWNSVPPGIRALKSSGTAKVNPVNRT
jgi:hypothetical protein